MRGAEWPKIIFRIHFCTPENLPPYANARVAAPITLACHECKANCVAPLMP
jgi:hypothetical protein